MESSDAIVVLAALAQETRLAAFRRLVEAGPGGLPAGEVAQALGVPHNTMSTHLAALSRAGLITGRRQSRLVIYRAELARLGALGDFLLRDCCGGQPEICAAWPASSNPSRSAA